MPSQSILFLQGPLGPFFRELAGEFSHHGYVTHKINFNAGDRLFSDADHCLDYRGSEQQWPEFLTCYLKYYRIKTVFVMGDCRLYHRLAKPVCEQLGVQFMVFEEGYLRPDTITLEQGGVNAFTALDLSPAALASAPRQRQKAPVPMPPSMKHRTLYASAYYWAASLQKKEFSLYNHHRAFSPVKEGAKWLRGAARKQRCKAYDADVLAQLTGELSGRFFLVALQVHDDSQMRYHSDYASVEAFIAETIHSFAATANAADTLVLKHHPMDRGYTHYQKTIDEQVQQLGIADRVIYCHDVPLPELYNHSKGVVTVNSTVGLSALLHKLPVKVMGRTFYDIRGLTSQCSLDQFWQVQEPVHSGLFNRLHALLFEQSQINGSFFNELPLTCRNTRLFYEQKFGQAHVPDTVPARQPLPDRGELVHGLPVTA